MPGISSDKGPPRASFIIDGRWRNELLLRALTGTSFFTMSTYIEDAGNLPWPKISPRLIYHRRALSSELLLRALTGTNFFTIRVNCCRSTKFSKMRSRRLRKIRRSDPNTSQSTLNEHTPIYNKSAGIGSAAKLLISVLARVLTNHKRQIAKRSEISGETIPPRGPTGPVNRFFKG